MFKLPTAIYDLPEEDQASRCDISPDFCAIDGDRRFLRGLLPLPVTGRSVPYRIGIWAEIDASSFKRILELWDDPHQAEAPPLAGALANPVPLCPSTIGLEVEIRLTGPTTRPEFFVKEANHQLAQDQRQGIGAHRPLQCASNRSGSSAS